MSKYLVRVQRRIPAPPQALFDVVARPAAHPLIDGSGTVVDAKSGNPERLSLGARFGMSMKVGARYSMANIVTEFDEPHQIAWQTRSGQTWRYIFEPDDGGTLVTEEWDSRTVRFAVLGVLQVLAGLPERSRMGMAHTLLRMERHVTR